MKDDDELEMLLGEIPHATSSFSRPYMLNNATNHHHHDNSVVDHGYVHASCMSQRVNGHHPGDDDESLKQKYMLSASPVSGFSLQSGGSSSSLLSVGGLAHSDRSLSPPLFEEYKPHLISSDGFCLDSKNAANESNLVDCLSLSRSFSNMYVRDEQEGGSVPPYGVQYHHDQSPNGANLSYRNGFSHSGVSISVPKNTMGFEGDASSKMVETPYDHRMSSLLGSRYSPSPSERMFYWSDFGSSNLSSEFYRNNMVANNTYPMGFVVPYGSPSLDNPSVGNPLIYSSPNRMNLIEASDSLYSSNMAQVAPLMPHYSEENLVHYQQSPPNGRTKVPFERDDSLITQGEGLDSKMSRNARSGGHNTKSYNHENGAWKTTRERRPKLNGHLHNAAIQDSYLSSKMYLLFNRPLKISSLSQVQGFIYPIAKDQQGCRFLQRMFEEGTAVDVQIIFDEIIDHAVELMMNPFGNYLMQKLLEVCTEKQRMQILFRVTDEPGELVRISLNTHGTRVVQKFIETIKTKQQIGLVISALEPGFLALIKDLNGNHVIQRCLQCFPVEDSKFIFVAAAKHCVEIATHQHGCCVLQRCISHSTGEYREKLVSEISANGFLLAEDAFGNYVVQFILELKIPYATSKLTSQFEGHYVHLSIQKFSSHVIEKCLTVCNDDVQAKIIHELLSATCFDQLLQDPHANYVIQTALRVSEGHLYNSLADAIQSHKPISRNSPYSKKIFSQKLLKR